MTEARGPGEIAFSRDGAGHVFPIHLQSVQAIEVREHQFLVATGNLDYGFSRQKGFANMLFGSTGFFVDRFAATQSEGVVWLHGYGNVFEKTLAPGEQIDVEPGGWIYRDESVRMDPQIYGLRTGVFGGSGNSFLTDLQDLAASAFNPCMSTCQLAKTTMALNSQVASTLVVFPSTLAPDTPRLLAERLEPLFM